MESVRVNEKVMELLRRIQDTADFGYVKFDSINATNALGDNALHCVCVWGDLEAAKLLVENGIDINQRGEYGFTPLRVAIDFGYTKIAEYLIANGADQSSIDAEGTFDPEKNSLHLQKIGEQIEDMERRIDNSWYQKERLHFAAANGDLEKVKRLIESGYDVNMFDDALSFTPLHYAVKSEHFKVVNFLLSVGADVNAHEEEKIGETPLGAVAANCSYEMAELLVRAGANPTIPGWMQITALDRARDRNDEEGRRVYELLVKVAVKRFNYGAK